MNVLLLLAHPSYKSFNAAIARKARSTLQELGHKVFFHDLYKEAFDPILPVHEIPKDGEYEPLIEKHCQELQQADGIIIVHPNWWGMPPAILKGWIDRVLRPGIAYEFIDGDEGEGVPVGLLKMQTALVFNTSDTKREREDNIFLDPLETLWKNCIFYLCGVKIFHRKMFRIMVTSSKVEREEWLKEVEITVAKYFERN